MIAIGHDGQARLLVVDDEQANVRLLERMLARAGYTNVASTSDPRQVLALYRSFDPDLILLDLGMPYLDGYGVMAELRRVVPEGTYLGDDPDRHVDLAVAGVGQMNTLLADLLAYSQAATAEPARAPVACDDVVATALARLDGAIAGSGAAVTVDPLPVVLGDRAQLVQVFDHLLRNAIKFRGDAPPRVHVSAEPSGRAWQLSVADNGIGIAPRHAERIFTLFQRLHHRDQYDGNGVGLGLCRRLVAHHGGRIWVDPNPGGGSVFRFTLPAADPADGSAEPSSG